MHLFHNKPLCQAIGAAAACFGAGILFSCILPGCVLAFVESVIMVGAGVLLFCGSRN